jgi:hypothetical protein
VAGALADAFVLLGEAEGEFTPYERSAAGDAVLDREAAWRSAPLERTDVAGLAAGRVAARGAATSVWVGAARLFSVSVTAPGAEGKVTSCAEADGA